MPKRKLKTVPVSTRALIQRIRRKLPEGEQLKSNRSPRWEGSLGHFYIVSVTSNTIQRTHIDLEVLGRELGALGLGEHLSDETPAGLWTPGVDRTAKLSVPARKKTSSKKRGK